MLNYIYNDHIIHYDNFQYEIIFLASISYYHKYFIIDMF